MTAALIAALVIAVLFAVLFGGAYRTADREVIAREHELRQTAAQLGDLVHTLIEQDAELVLTREACDRQTVKARHMLGQAQGYRAEVARLSARNAELRDLADGGKGTTREPTLTEEFVAWLAEQPTTEEREYPR